MTPVISSTENLLLPETIRRAKQLLKTFTDVLVNWVVGIVGANVVVDVTIASAKLASGYSSNDWNKIEVGYERAGSMAPDLLASRIRLPRSRSARTTKSSDGPKGIALHLPHHRPNAKAARKIGEATANTVDGRAEDGEND